MSVSTVSATVQDPSGQAFANGTWQLVFKPTPNTPGPFTDSGVAFTTLYSGSLDGTGSFSQANVNRNDTIAPGGSRWTLIVAPNSNSQAFSIDLNVNNGAFSATALVNSIVTNITISATIIARAYKDSEVIPIPGSGGLYIDVTLKVIKYFDVTNGTWITVSSGLSPVPFTPVTHNFLTGMNSSGVFSSAQPAFTDIAGVLVGAQLPNPSATTLGGVESLAAVASRWINQISTSGVPSATQPASTDLSDVATLSTLTGTQILTNKRITPRNTALATSTTFTPNSDTTDIATMNMTGVAGTLTIAAPTGTPTDGQKLIIRVTATNAQTYSFNATYHFSTTVTAPTAITATKTDYIGCMWNATTTVWDVVAVDQGH